MPQILLFFVFLYLIYILSKQFSRKEQRRFERMSETSNQNDLALTLEKFDPKNEVVVNFYFKQISQQFLVNSSPNLIIDNRLIFKLEKNFLQLKLSNNFDFFFYVPYMGGKSFKLKKSLNLLAGHEYDLIIIPKPLVFQTPKIEIIDNGLKI